MVPIGAFVLVGEHGRLRKAITLMAGSIAVGTVFAIERNLMLAFAFGYVYFAVATLIVHRWLRPMLSDARVTQGAVFAILFFLFVVFPGTALSPWIGAMLLIGWELALKGYSYLRETCGRPALLRDCALFILCDPTIVYVDRARRVQGCVTRQSFLRIGLGLFLGAIAAGVLSRLVAHAKPTNPSEVAVFGGLRFLSLYAAFSGLAHVQVPLMRLAGYVVPERYNFPFLARDPLDFWRRWNTYVGRWAQRYLFLPAMRRVRAGSLRGAIALGSTFLAVGGLHDAYTYFGDFTLRLPSTTSFALIAASTLLWLTLDEALRRARAGRVPRQVVAQASFVVLLLLGAAYWR
ncbi:MAG: hypothetical protein IPM35_34075 [Myxococcales bacterium]|nr:hypothetical protein [Myxococcales bacterium]